MLGINWTNLPEREHLRKALQYRGDSEVDGLIRPTSDRIPPQHLEVVMGLFFKSSFFVWFTRLFLLLCLTSCAAPDVSQYAGKGPVLDLKTYFNGRLMAHGMFMKRGGEVARRFKVTMDASWRQDNGIWVGTLDEAFEYDDGEKQQRIWTLREISPGVFEGTAPDVVGKATGRSSGHALRWQYTLSLPVGQDRYEVHFDDWMHLIDDRVMLNKAVMTKFGIQWGEVFLSFQKP